MYQMCMRPGGGGGGGVTPTTIYTYYEEAGRGSLKRDFECMFVKNEIFLVRGEESRGPRLDVIFVENLT